MKQKNRQGSKRGSYHDDGLLVHNRLLLLGQNSLLVFWRRNPASKQEEGIETLCSTVCVLYFNHHIWYKPVVTGATAATGGNITPPTGRTLTAADTSSQFLSLLMFCHGANKLFLNLVKCEYGNIQHVCLFVTNLQEAGGRRIAPAVATSLQFPRPPSSCLTAQQPILLPERKDRL